MNSRILIILLTSLFTLNSCKENKSALAPNTNVRLLQNEFMSWWNYHNDYINLSIDFIAYNESDKMISKKEFLSQLRTGNFIPVKLITTDNLEHYKLYSLQSDSDKSIQETIKLSASTAYQYFSLEGTLFPHFDLTDLNGTTYTNENTKGKTIILKCWFINCTACVKEFHELNQLVSEYQRSDKILFLSLASDKNEKLRTFLNRKPLQYATVGLQSDFMNNVLNVKEYPTHYIIDPNGVIKKVVSNVEDLLYAIRKMKL